jgi:hypothetical protein
VVVAACALEAEAEEDIAGGVGDVVEDGVPLTGGVAVIVFVDAAAEVAGGDDGFGVVREEFVAGELFHDEAVPWLVRVEGSDDVVAIAPCVWAVVVGFIAVAVGVADEVEPVAGPALAVLWGREETVDEVFPCGWGGVAEEAVDFGGWGGEAEESEPETAGEGGAGGFWGEVEVSGEETSEEEGVDRVWGGLGDGRRGDWLEGPP